MSLYDELDVAILDEESVYNSRQHFNQGIHKDNLADELGNAFEDETYESESDTLRLSNQISDTIQQESKLAMSQYNYTGDDWGDPAEDSDPDGRFEGLNEAIHTFCEVLDLDPDSAYMSDDASTGPEYEPSMQKLDVEDRTKPFLAGLRTLDSQGPIEHKTLKLVYGHDLVIQNLDKFMSEIRELVQTHLHGTSLQLLSTYDIQALSECFRLLQESLPEKVDAASVLSLSLLEAETNALIADLYLLGDSSQECKQISCQAQRSLKSVKDACDAWKIENNQIQQAQAWLLEQDIEHKLQQRIFSKELVEIKTGFEDFCGRLRNEIEAN